LWCIDKLGIKRYDWLGRHGKKSVADWEIFVCHRRLGNNILQLIFFSGHFLCSFFIMNAFLVPPTHPWVCLRMCMWAGGGALGFREAYMDIESWNTPARKHNLVQGRYRWLASCMIMTEGFVCYKYRVGTGHITDTPTPLYISIPWIGSALAIAFGFLYLRFKPGHTQKYPGLENENREPLSPRKRRSSPKKKAQ